MKTFFSFFVAMLLVLPLGLNAQEVVEPYRASAVVVEVLHVETNANGLMDYSVIVETQEGDRYSIDTAESFTTGLSHALELGDNVYIRIIEDEQEIFAYFEDVQRSNSIYLMIALFSLLTLIVGKVQGLRSLAGLGITVFTLGGFILPRILSGADPVLTTVLGSIVILAVNMHLSHSADKKTFFAFLSTLIGLLLVVMFAYLFVSWAKLSGLSSEESALLIWDVGTIQLPVGILLAGIVLGAVGVLDDIAITQTEIVSELVKSNKNLSKKELFSRAMHIGRHHIASTVNTLVLVYAGAALPVLLLYLHTTDSWGIFLQNELVAEELVRTIAGTCALVLTVPISTFLAVLSQSTFDKEAKQA